MPPKIDLKKIAKRNPNLDLQSLEEWRKLRRRLIKNGLQGKRSAGRSPYQGKRARIIDDLDSDPRLVKLQRHL